MSGTDLACPVCGAELDLATVFAAHVDHQALERLVNAGFPIGSYLLRYIGLHKPPKQALTLRKKFKLLAELLPDLERQRIARAGRDWVAPKANWALAIDQMVHTAHSGGLDLPLKGHGYLYAVLQKMADKAEAAQERQAEADKRGLTTATVQVRGQAMPMGQALAQVYGGRDPALAALDHSARTAAPMPAEVRAKLDALRGRKPATNADTDTPNTEEPRP